ncbi:MAG TPA: TetR/AcrR family transcriptional regulator [candidate division WOR-3 bacterium]|uniref:TetR/AcrR family transcriptional regulator n=1 Tax=candidate division WOR-3 bacterium TaxID=2052148 RepID=A0A7C5I4I9_UNCW3|nr:TetR/AcrR family transcriptional regulator [candidate division WOR-3 bacterium]
MDKKNYIIEVAKSLVGKFGFKKTTMEDIAKAARMGKATLYYYFSSKDDIFREIIEKEGNRFRKKLLEALEGAKTAREKLLRYSFTRFHFLKEVRLYYKTIKDELYSHLDFIERERKKFDKFDLEILERIMEEGVEKGEFNIKNPKYYAFLLLQAIKGLEVPILTGEALSFENKEVDLDEAVSALLNILMYGILKNPQA